MPKQAHDTGGSNVRARAMSSQYVVKSSSVTPDATTSSGPRASSNARPSTISAYGSAVAPTAGGHERHSQRGEHVGRGHPVGHLGGAADEEDPGQQEEGDHERRGHGASARPMRPASPLASERAITIRWIWLVPSKICITLASRMKRSTGKSFV